MTATAWGRVGSHEPGQVWQRARSDPAYGAFLVLRIGLAVLPIWMGADKFVNWLTYWPHYLAPWIAALLPISAQTAMYVVGVIEIVAGLAVAFKPRYAAYVTAWLTGIVINLLSYPGFHDVALRDFGLVLAAFALARLAAVYDAGRTGAHRKTTAGNEAGRS